MDNRKLERIQKARDQWVQEHPEEVRRLQERAKSLAEYLNSPEWHAFWQPAKAVILSEEKTGIRNWAETRIGRKLNSVLGVHLGAKELGARTPRETWWLVDGWREKLASNARSEANAKEAAVFYRTSKKYPRLKRALSEYPDPNREIERASWMARRESQSGRSPTMGKIEWRIEGDNLKRGLDGVPRQKGAPTLDRLRGQVRTRRAALRKANFSAQKHAEAMRALWAAEEQLEHRLTLTKMSSFDEHPMLLEGLHDDAAFMEEENRRQQRLLLSRYLTESNEAGLSPREMEVAQLSVFLENRGIAEIVGRPANQVAQEKFRATNKIRKAIGL